ncbi:MAG: DAK2 domain-containing protein [Clostridiales Family XIII bacterium]|jgi:dihydroxyacetone kinase-like protein|nr:DAK2 domain-containing protein [Clostridiales Family XIII bacterium]
MDLTVTDFKRIFRAWTETMNDHKEYLIKLDAIAGDGDLGLAMTDGFNAVLDAVDVIDNDNIGFLFYQAGKAMSVHAPSSLGTLIAFGLMDAGKSIEGKTQIAKIDLWLLLEAFENAIMAHGKSKPGDKTFLDGLDPAVQEMKKIRFSAEFHDILRIAAIKARHGAMNTVGLRAKHGRIAVRGEDSRQILDPGAFVAALMITSLSTTLSDDNDK